MASEEGDTASEGGDMASEGGDSDLAGQSGSAAGNELTAPSSWLDRYLEVRRFTERLAAPLSPEDCVVQSMADASPVRWHLAHTTWFFETFLLPRLDSAYRPVNPAYEYLFNSYYNSVGRQFPRARRGVLTRPSVAEILDYRREVDRRVAQWLGDSPPAERPLVRKGAGREDDRWAWWQILELGLHHEQQHQELILTDVLHLLSCNPLYPRYIDSSVESSATGDATGAAAAGFGRPADWLAVGEALVEVGWGDAGFCFDNERPRHKVWLHAHELACLPVSNGEYLEFVLAGGYQRPEYWLSAGWQQVQTEGWEAPLYWLGPEAGESGWRQFTLCGLLPLDLEAPVSHVSYFEADAYARWAGGRLPTEFEWERAAEAAQGSPETANFVERGAWRPLAPGPSRCEAGSTPAAAGSENGRGNRFARQLLGDVWEWTSSPYTAYPGYLAENGALGEYNGKFMCNQYVLRGGSCATPSSHLRLTYRNFFPPAARWQFSGFRLAR